MTQEEKQLLLIDLCARLPYGVMLDVPIVGGSETKKLVSVIQEDTGMSYVTTYSNEERGSDGNLISYKQDVFGVCDVLPYLRSMSSMTEEEREEVNDLNMNPFSSSVIDWLNAHYLDYKGLIEKGLALEAPKDMYNTKN